MKILEATLSKEERKSIRSELTEILLSYLTMIFIACLVLATLVALIKKSETEFIVMNRSYILFTLFYTIILGLGLLIWKTVRNQIADLIIGKKNIYTAILNEKRTKENLGWHGNRIVDSSMRPVFTEYMFTLGNQEVHVEKEHYDQFNIGDVIEMSIAVKTNKLLKIEKQQKETSN